MKAFTKLTAISSIFLAGSMAFSDHASADICSGLETLQQFALDGVCSEGDKDINWVADNGVSDRTTMEHLFNQSADQWSFRTFTGTGNQEDGESYSVDYHIKISGDNFFNTVALDIDVPSGDSGIVVTKYIWDSFAAYSDDVGSGVFDETTQTIVRNGSQGGSGFVEVCGGCKEIWVRDQANINPFNTSNTLTGFTNAFTQRETKIPEPATTALLGLGIVGFGIARRHRRKAASA